MQLKKKEANRLEYEKKILDSIDRWVDNAISKEEDDQWIDNVKGISLCYSHL